MLQVRPMSSAPALGSVSGVCPLVIGLPPSYVCGNVNVLHVQQEGGGSVEAVRSTRGRDTGSCCPSAAVATDAAAVLLLHGI